MRGLLIALLLAAPAAFATTAAADAEYRLFMRCPEAAPGVGVPAGCPTYVLDREDVLGSPRLVLDPRDANVAAFAALHGGRGVHPIPGAEPPTGRSRDDAVHQPHTTFASRDGGASWNDMPYHAPDSMRAPGREIYGDDVAIALDADGRLHLAALYSTREAAAPFAEASPFQSVVAVWKARNLGRPVDYHANLKLLQPVSDPLARIDAIHLAAVPGGVALLWRETTPEGATSVALHRTASSEGAAWTPVDLGITGCDAISNPVALGERLALGCRDNATGAWRVHAIDPATWTSALLGESPVTTQSALLVPRYADLLVLVGSGVAEDETPTVQLSYGEGGARWSGVEEIAPQLTRGASVAPLVSARVTAAVYQPVSGNLHLVYLERYDAAQGGQEGAGRPELYKTFASVQAEGSFQSRIDLAIGTVNRAAFSPTLTGVGPDAFDDLHDGLVVWQDPRSGAWREFVAFGDYGFVRYAEVVEENFLSPIAPLSAQVPPVPLSSAGSVPVMVGVPAGLLAGAMVARAIYARKAAAAEAPAE